MFFRIHLILHNAYKPMCFDRNINKNRDECDYLLVQRCVKLTLQSSIFPKAKTQVYLQLNSDLLWEIGKYYFRFQGSWDSWATDQIGA